MDINIEVCDCGHVMKGADLKFQKLTCSQCGLMKWNGSTSSWADQETFDQRKECHSIFDSRWLCGALTRSEAYRELGFHFGQASKETLKTWLKENR